MPNTVTIAPSADFVDTTHMEGSQGPVKGPEASAAIDVPSLTDTTPSKHQHSTSAQLDDTPAPITTLTVAAAGSTMSSDTIPLSAVDSSSGSGSLPDTPDALVAARPVTHSASTAIETETNISEEAAQHVAVTGGDIAVVTAANNSGAAGPNGLCPVVAFTSFAAQLSFKAIQHLVVFGGGYHLAAATAGQELTVMKFAGADSLRMQAYATNGNGTRQTDEGKRMHNVPPDRFAAGV